MAPHPNPRARPALTTILLATLASVGCEPRADPVTREAAKAAGVSAVASQIPSVQVPSVATVGSALPASASATVIAPAPAPFLPAPAVAYGYFGVALVDERGNQRKIAATVASRATLSLDRKSVLLVTRPRYDSGRPVELASLSLDGKLTVLGALPKTPVDPVRLVDTGAGACVLYPANGSEPSFLMVQRSGTLDRAAVTTPSPCIQQETPIPEGRLAVEQGSLVDRVSGARFLGISDSAGMVRVAYSPNRRFAVVDVPHGIVSDRFLFDFERSVARDVTTPSVAIPFAKLDAHLAKLDSHAFYDAGIFVVPSVFLSDDVLFAGAIVGNSAVPEASLLVHIPSHRLIRVPDASIARP